MQEMVINLSGTSFLDANVIADIKQKSIKEGNDCYIKQHGQTVHIYDADYAVLTVDGDHHVGWIPQMKTINKYIGEAFKSGDRFKHDMLVKRAKYAEKIRNNIATEIHRNNSIPSCKIESVYISPTNESVVSVSVRFFNFV